MLMPVLSALDPLFDGTDLVLVDVLLLPEFDDFNPQLVLVSLQNFSFGLEVHFPLAVSRGSTSTGLVRSSPPPNVLEKRLLPSLEEFVSKVPPVGVNLPKALETLDGQIKAQASILQSSDQIKSVIK